MNGARSTGLNFHHRHPHQASLMASFLLSHFNALPTSACRMLRRMAWAPMTPRSLAQTLDASSSPSSKNHAHGSGLPTARRLPPDPKHR